jgi:DNA-binding MarR family transcriptional regulator
MSNYLTASYHPRCLDVKRNFVNTANVTKKQPERDHIDSWLAEIAPRLPSTVDLDVEGIVDRIGGLNWRIRKMLDETLAEQGLVHGDWKVLISLQWAEPQRRSAGELARRAELTSGTMTARLDHLEREGLVRRLGDPGDRRSVLVELTAKGRKKVAQAMGVQGQKEKLIAEALTPKEIEQLNALLRKVMVSAESRITER